ncbi:MAG: hypothetical protein ACI4HN_02710, partial [Ruminococcus sp.]
MKCQYCGNELKENAKFCDGCGVPVKQPLNPIQQQFVTNNNPQLLPKKKRLKAWHIILIVLGGIFALIGLFFCFVLWIGFTFGTVESESQNQSTQAVVATTAEPTIEATTAVEYELDIENTLKNITYFTPSEFDTKGTSGLIFNHKSPDNDNLLVSYTELGENIALYTESQANELLDGTVEGAKGDREDFELYNKKYVEIASCYGIDFSYKMEDIYVHNYSFLWKDGAYQ